ncbi:MAG TPA: phage holin family protein [Pseudomonadales bacterium]
MAVDSAVAAAPSTGPPGLLDDVAGLAREVQALALDQLQLVALEAKLAGRQLVVMLGAAIGIGILVATIWLSMIAAIVWSLIAAGIAPAIALLIMTLLNVVGAAICYRLIRRGLRTLGFPATLRSLKAAGERSTTT